MAVPAARDPGIIRKPALHRFSRNDSGWLRVQTGKYCQYPHPDLPGRGVTGNKSTSGFKWGEGFSGRPPNRQSIEPTSTRVVTPTGSRHWVGCCVISGRTLCLAGIQRRGGNNGGGRHFLGRLYGQRDSRCSSQRAKSAEANIHNGSGRLVRCWSFRISSTSPRGFLMRCAIVTTSSP
jgi:hypothetical protein